MNSKLSISINEARKLLGNKNLDLSDNQVEEIIKYLSLIAENYLGKNSSKKQQGVE